MEIPDVAANLTVPSPLTILSWLWLIGIIILLLIHGISYISYRRSIIKNALAITNTDYLYEFKNQLNSLQIRKNIPLLVWSGISSPMMIGFRNPCLILPNESYPVEEIHFILKHELLHYKRHDIYGKLLLAITKIIHWFNPVVALMCKVSKTKKRNGIILLLVTVLLIAGCQTTTENKPAMYLEANIETAYNNLLISGIAVKLLNVNTKVPCTQITDTWHFYIFYAISTNIELY